MAQGKTMQAVVSIAGTVDPSLLKSISTAQKSIHKMGASYMAIGKIALGATIAGVVALGAVTAKCVDNAIDLQKQMSNVATLIDGDVSKRVGELQADVLKLSDTTSVATDDLTSGLYETISAFGDNEESIKRLEIAAKAAKAGNATTIESIGLLSAITKGYGDTSAEAMKKAADMSFLIVKLGQTNFPELAASMGRVVPLASAMKLKQEELSGAFATLTGVTGKAAEVSTQLRAILQGFMKPTKEMSEAVKQAGYKSAQAMLQTLGLQKSLLLLKKGCRGSTTAVAGLFSSVESGTAVMALIDAQAGAMAEKTKAMFESSGIAEKAYEAQMNNFAAKWGKIMNLASNFMTKIGVKILPALEGMLDKAMPYLLSLSEKLTPLLEGMLDKLIASFQRAGESIALFIRSIDFEKLSGKCNQFGEALERSFGWILENGPGLLKVLKSLGTAFLIYKTAVVSLTALHKIYTLMTSVTKIWTVAQNALNVALTANPVGLVIAAIAALIAIGYLLWDNWDDICKWFGEAWTWLKELFAGVCEALSSAWQWMCDAIGTAWNACGEWLSSVWTAICDALKAAWTIYCTSIQTAWDMVCRKVKGMWDGLVSWFRAGIQVWASIGNRIGQALKDAFTSVRDWVMQIVDSILAKFTSLFDGIKDAGNKVKGWFGFGGDNSSAIPAKAAGGFTSGPSLCGEAGTEAVISFDPRYRAENRGYLMSAAEMLGMDLSRGAETSRQSVVSYHLGGVTFAPVIKAGAGTTPQDIVRQLKDSLPELLDMIQEGLAERSVGKYA